MRVLVVGPYPLPATRETGATMATVRRLAEEGASVEVMSWSGTAAHHHGRLVGPRGALQVWRRRGHDCLVVHVASVSPLRPGSSRWGRMLDCLAWGLLLRRSPRATLVVEDPDAVPGYIGGRSARFLWASAREVIVGGEGARQRFEQAGCAPSQLGVATRETVVAQQWNAGWGDIGDRDTAMDHIRRRAADDRLAARAARRSS